MLVLSRNRQESIIIDAGPAGLIKIVVVEFGHGKVRLGIECGREIPVHREEIWLAIQKAKAVTHAT